jgi:uncharacterized protein with beta-barrel porin domain
MAATAMPAAAQSWNLYSGNPSVQTSFANGPISTANAGPELFLTLSGHTTRFTMDTGSTGILATPDFFKPSKDDTLVGSGSQVLTSSGIVYSGDFYQTNVVIDQTQNGPNNTTQAGPALATSKVTILQVKSITCLAGYSQCKPDAHPKNVAYMGVGYNRGTSGLQPPAPYNNTNALLNAVTMSGQAIPPGYLITNSGITLGLTSTNTAGFAFVKLQPNPGATDPSSVWQGAPMTVNVVHQTGGGSSTGSGGILPDTGIPYAFLKPPPGVGLAKPCPGGQAGQFCFTKPITVYLSGLGPSGPQASYSFTGADTSNPSAPTQVQNDAASSDPFLNTGRNFYWAFNYLYDQVNGFVGYSWANTPGTTGGVTPFLSLTGTFALPDGFTNSLSTYLYGDTTLQQTGSGTFSAPILGNGNSLSLAGPGGITFGGAIDLGGGMFNLQQGQATINGGLTAGGLTITGQGLLVGNSAINLGTGLFSLQQGSVTNNGSLTASSVAIGSQGTFTNNSQITANVMNGGTLTNNGTITGNVTNNGLLNGDGTITGQFVNNGTHTGSPTIVGDLANSGVLNINGSVVGDVANSGLLAGNPTIGGNLANSGVISPGNSIGTIRVAGNADLGSGTTYLVEVNAQGRNDAVSVRGSTAIRGGTVAALPMNGVYAPRTSYTILSSARGVSGNFSMVSSSNPFLLPSLSYGANDVVLTMTIGGFLAVAQTPVQAAVGGALDGSVLQASGDYAQVLGNLAASNPGQVPAILTSLSGMNYSGFSNSMVQTAQLFMSNFSDMAGGTARGRNKVALAQACDVASDTACDTTEAATWGAWGGGLGGLGTVGSGASLGGVTYNVAGFAGGLDRHFTDNFQAGVALGYTTGSQWVSGFSGQGFSNTVQAGLYGSWLQGPVYVDGIAGYAYSGNQLNRGVNIPGMAGRTAVGQAGANQLYGQVEGGYRVDIGGNAEASITPFARVQGYTGTQNAFTESGAQSVDLNVAAQTTNSLRTVVGAQIGGAMNLGWRDKLAAQLRLGWSHEYADTSRPVSVSFVGAPDARWRGGRLLGQHGGGRCRLALRPLRRQHRRPGLEPRLHRRGALRLVSRSLLSPLNLLPQRRRRRSPIAAVIRLRVR